MIFDTTQNDVVDTSIDKDNGYKFLIHSIKTTLTGNAT